MKITCFILLWFLLICPNSFCQQGQRDGINKEYYENGKLKFEYMVKNEKFNGFYEKYDEDGNLEYRQYYIDGMFDGTDRTYFYYPLFTWFHHIGDEAEEVKLDTEDALELFGEEYALADEPFAGNRMGIIRTRIPKNDQGGKLFPVTLAGLSKNYIYLKEFKERKDSDGSRHHYYDLIKKYKIRRDDEIDGLFNAGPIEEVFKRRHTGVEFGTPFARWKTREGGRLKTVQQYLGEPDFVRKPELAGWFDVYYSDENLHIIGHSSAVYFLEERSPDWVNTPESR